MNTQNCNVCEKPAELIIGKKKVPFCSDCATKKFLSDTVHGTDGTRQGAALSQ